MSWEVRQGDCLDVLPMLAEGSVDACVTDPPYGLEFMGKGWDGADGFRRSLNAADVGRESVFGRTSRTSPEYRGGALFQEFVEAWAREALRVLRPGAYLLAFGGTRTYHRLAVAIEDGGFKVQDCLSWLYGQGFPKGKTQLKPAWEPILLAYKPGKRTLNVDECRIEYDGDAPSQETWNSKGKGGKQSAHLGQKSDGMRAAYAAGLIPAPSGRWPANVVLDEEAAALLDEQSGESTSSQPRERTGSRQRLSGFHMTDGGGGFGDTGGASRFFYTAKADSGERHYAGRNNHPTVKPVDLMRWLVRLVTPPGGLVLDPFTGSGSTGVAALAEGRRFLGIEREAEYVGLARRRIAGPLFAEALKG